MTVRVCPVETPLVVLRQSPVRCGSLCGEEAQMDHGARHCREYEVSTKILSRKWSFFDSMSRDTTRAKKSDYLAQFDTDMERMPLGAALLRWTSVWRIFLLCCKFVAAGPMLSSENVHPIACVLKAVCCSSGWRRSLRMVILLVSDDTCTCTTPVLVRYYDLSCDKARVWRKRPEWYIRATK